MAFKKEVEEIIEPKDIFVGKKDAPVTLMEFGEYENEDCAKANEVVKQLLEEYEGKIKFNFRHFPLTLIHQRSMKASEAAVAAGVRRIEAVSGPAAENHIKNELSKLASIAEALKSPKDIVKAIDDLNAENNILRKKVESMENRMWPPE